MTEVLETLDSYPTKNDKRERKQNAQTLPPGITQNMMKKYVVYYREILKLKSGKEQLREYFKVESHPKLSKPWVSSKSIKVLLIEKLNDANQLVKSLDNDNDNHNDNDNDNHNDNDDQPDIDEQNNIISIAKRWTKYIPKYTMLRVIKTTPTTTNLSLVYDKKDNVNGQRWTSTYTFSCPTASLSGDETIEKPILSLGIHNLRNKLRKKYGTDICGL